MGRHIAVIGTGFLALALVAGLSGWALFGAATPTPTGWSLGPIWLYILGAVVLFAALAGFLMWLAAFSTTRREDRERREP